MFYIFSDQQQPICKSCCFQIMMKAVCFLMALTAFGCALGQRKGITVAPTRDTFSIQTVPACPEICNCTRMDLHSAFKKAICPRIPSSLHYNIKSLQVIGDIYSVTREQILQIGGELYMLDLSGCNIINIEQGAFNSMNNLVSLKLSNNNIKEISSGMFSSSHLKVIYLDGNNLENIENDAFSQLKTLQKLYLQHNKLLDIPITFPGSLNILDISHNHISTITMDLSKINLKTLDLCGNPLNGFPSIKSSRTLETICLEGKAAVLPYHTAANFPQLADITLVALTHPFRAELDSTTQSELSKVKKLITLSIVNYHIQNLSFLTGMKNLASLKLQNITLQSYHGIDKVIESLEILSNLSLDQSTHLVKPILTNEQLVSQLTRLHYLSLRHTQLVSLTQENIPENTRLDISYNPLHCDCHLVWIQYRERDTLGKFLLSKKETTCEMPNNAEGHMLLESVSPACNEEHTAGVLEQTSDNPEWMYTSDAYLSSTSTEVPIKDRLTNISTASNGTNIGKSVDNTTIYIVLGIVLIILIIVGTALAVTLSILKRKRKCQISPNGGETPMEQQHQQMKQASSKDMLIKK
ncbi:Leucine-rich repeat and immunoglobulin-like domain containing-NOGO receptor-interacting protein 4 [Zootermopsis nevadensis]|uniref:Leucine-rich repeat and immunoglobulin-like domain containing-NOGO receptor-interacting protein 4 n=2 Tax=Zootermopsis nevadensis TaxID=136037 RepID=A0A067QKW8_ZOONE|nr:Leucine-rich repeat and immunoglobulin-like domain containing-NOGO receptor-interacting protein 4 [Zootermopsis nevadensis]